VVDELIEEFLDDSGLDVPVVDLLLLQLVARVPVGLDVVLGEVLGEAVSDEELFVFCQFGQLVLLLYHLS
jgi:hypothetical protein